jgi:hypothetical protein
MVNQDKNMDKTKVKIPDNEDYAFDDVELELLGKW